MQQFACVESDNDLFSVIYSVGSNRVHGGGSRLPPGRCDFQLREQDRRQPPHERLSQPVFDRSGTTTKSSRTSPSLRPHRGGLSGEFAGAHLLPDALQHLQRVPGRHQRGRAAQRPHGLPGHA